MAVDLAKRFGKFAIVGGTGFIIDGGILALLVYLTTIDPVHARFISFSVAVSATWWINRNYTFSDRKSDNKLHEWFKYCIANSPSAILNLVIYTKLISLNASFVSDSIVAFVISSGLAMILSFTINIIAIFRKNNNSLIQQKSYHDKQAK